MKSRSSKFRLLLVVTLLTQSQIQLVSDKKKYLKHVEQMLIDYYGEQGPSPENENYRKYKMLPEALRVSINIFLNLFLDFVSFFQNC